MPRFVLLYHRCPPGYPRPSHWDLMLESGDMLRTWALAALPRAWQAAHSRTLHKGDCPPLGSENEVEALQLADHRLAYLHFEGALSEQRGTVFRVAEGNYCVQGDETDNRLDCTLDGDTLTGRFTLRRGEQSAEQWTLESIPAHEST